MRLSTFNNTPPNGAPGASATTSTGVGALGAVRFGLSRARGAARERRSRFGCNASGTASSVARVDQSGLDDAHQPIAEAERCDDGFRRSTTRRRPRGS